MDQQQPIVAKAEMLIRKLVPDRFPDAVKEHWRGRTA
jgi:hypothetical protein